MPNLYQLFVVEDVHKNEAPIIEVLSAIRSKRLPMIAGCFHAVREIDIYKIHPSAFHHLTQAGI